jgi:hypothetical protein
MPSDTLLLETTRAFVQFHAEDQVGVGPRQYNNAHRRTALTQRLWCWWWLCVGLFVCVWRIGLSRTLR